MHGLAAFAGLCFFARCLHDFGAKFAIYTKEDASGVPSLHCTAHPVVVLPMNPETTGSKDARQVDVGQTDARVAHASCVLPVV